MKKVLAIILCLSLVFAFAACGKDAKKSDAKKTESQTDVATTAVKTVKDGKLIMATNASFPPYEYHEGGKIIGIDAEIAGEIAKKLGLELVIEDMEFASIISAVQADSVDFGMAGMTVNEDRLKEVDFSISYANGVQAIIVKEDSPIKTVDDLFAEDAAYKVGVQLGTTGDIYSVDDFGEDLVTQYTTGNEAVVALLGGDIDCVIIDNEPAKAYVANNKGLKVLDTAYADEDYAICIKKGNTALKDAVDVALEELIADGTVAKIVAKYIK